MSFLVARFIRNDDVSVNAAVYRKKTHTFNGFVVLLILSSISLLFFTIACSPI